MLSGSPHATASPRQHRVGRGLTVFEFSTALVLLICAGLLARSYARVLAVDLGFRPEGLLVTSVVLPSSRYSNASTTQFFIELLERVRNLPGVESAALADGAPLGGAAMAFSMRDSQGKETPPIDIIVVTHGYFRTAGTPLLVGRDFGPEDRARGRRVAVVNTTVAHLMYSDVHAVGQLIHLPEDSGRGTTIVGVVKDVPRALEAAAHPTVFLPAGQVGLSVSANLLIRTHGVTATIQRPVWQAIRSMDAELTTPRFTAMEQVISTAGAPRRFNFVVLATFALLAGALAAVGLYGVLSYLVADRQREIGIRLALGAEPQRLVQLVVVEGMRLAFVGLFLGLGGSLVAVRLLRHMLFGVSVYDPLAFVAGAVLLTLVALVACWVPAHRAARIEPMVVLRE
jgi:putative ABC transport system permease protein